METIFVKEHEQARKWYVIDAAGKPLGRVAAKAAVTGGKEKKKIYYHHTGFVGGLRAHTYEKLLEKHPTQPMEIAVAGMLPHGRLGRKMMDCVKIYAGAEHPHAAQNPQPVEL